MKGASFDPDSRAAPELALSVVVPACDEEQSIGPLVHEIHAALREREPSYEILVVDDGSSDETSARAAQAGGARVLRHPRNRGQSAALLTGIWQARGRVIVTLDGDGQNDPADIPALLDALTEPSVDAAQGVRRVDREGAWPRQLADRAGSRLRRWLLGDELRDPGCALRAFLREDALRLPQFDGLHRLLSVVLSLQGLAIAQVPTHQRPRCAGVSKHENAAHPLRGAFDLLGLLWLRRRLLRGRGEVRPARPAPRLGLEALAILLLVLLPALAARSLWSSDELRSVEVAREVAETGDWVALHLNGETYAREPPLYFWSVAALHGVSGVSWEGAGRLVSLLAVLGCAGCVWHLAGTLYGAGSAAGFAALACATSACVLDLGQEALIDPLVLAGSTAAVAAYVRAGAQEGAARWRWSALGALALSATCLTQGPAGWVAAGLGTLTLGGARGGRRGVPWLGLGLGLVLAVGLTLSWARAAADRAGEWVWQAVVVEQTSSRFSTRRDLGSEPWHYYLLHFSPLLLPWLALLPGAARWAWRERERPAARAALGAFAWGALGLAAFSLLAAKRTGYALPFAPAFALAIGYALAHAHEESWLRGPLRLVSPLLSLLALSCVVLGVVWRDLAGPLARLGARPASWGPLVLLPAAVACWALARARRRPPGGAARALAWGTGIAATLLLALGGGSLDPDRSLRAFGAQVRQTLPAQARVGLLGDTYDGRFNLVTRTLRYERIELSWLARAANQPGELWLLASGARWQHVPEDLRRRFEIAREARLRRGRCRYLLLRERASAPR
ncbi:MAG TPA: hypothetical protein DEA08_13555 [Planctomycetes bacterium]|nr:hypothetical protein [Planctomycetota bacterium]